MPTKSLCKISVIIVNYNVEYFLDQCLSSVRKALQYVQGEVFVVDNNSKDGSVQMVAEKFPEYTLIANRNNVGFSKANNQAIAQAKGEYVLLLNPDTLIEEDTLKKVVDFMDQHPYAGGLGVKMVDGRGRFLPESKRGLPTPSVAFYKIFGLAKLFPKSQRFGRYHLGYLDASATNEIEILSGAFMLIRKKTLQKSGWLDETFFMYGEDIDLSYRITRVGYKNYYFPHTSIIHYKGESTKKSSVNYIFVFYRAMVIFANKHFAPKNARLFSFFIHLAIYLRAFFALASRIGKRYIPPFVDFVILTSGIMALTHRWETQFSMHANTTLLVLGGCYAMIWMIAMFYRGVYRLPFRFLALLKGVLWGMSLNLLVNICLPQNYHVPFTFLLWTMLFVGLYYSISRLFVHFIQGESSKIFPRKTRRFAIVGQQMETLRVSRLLKRFHPDIQNVVFVDSKNNKNNWSNGFVDNLSDIIRQNRTQEIVFCSKDVSNKDIIKWMVQLSNTSLQFKIAPQQTSYLIGSNSIDTAGDLYRLPQYALSEASHLRNKRSFDIVVSSLALLSLPCGIWCFEYKKQYLKNIFNVLIGTYSWVGYAATNNKTKIEQLPKVKKGILSPILPSTDSKLRKNSEHINERYAKKYTVKRDIFTLIKSWKNMDRLCTEHENG